jgi:exonuclease VII small subunit
MKIQLTQQLKKINSTPIRRVVLAALVSAGVFIVLPAAAAGDGQTLYEEAVIQETGERNLEKAIELYKQVLAQVPADDPLAAKIYLQMGVCLEKLGFAKWEEAKGAYQSALNAPGGKSSDIIQTAEARLAALNEKIARLEAQAVALEQPKPKKLGWLMTLDIPLRTGSGVVMPWVSLGHGISSLWRVGGEIGYKPKQRTQAGYFDITDNSNTAAYVGPYIEGKIGGGRFSLFLRSGVGVTYTREESYVGFFSDSVKVTRDHFDPTLLFTVAADYRVYRGLSLRMGLRPAIIFPTDSRGIGTGGYSDLFNPFVGMGLQF